MPPYGWQQRAPSQTEPRSGTLQPAGEMARHIWRDGSSIRQYVRRTCMCAACVWLYVRAPAPLMPTPSLVMMADVSAFCLNSLQTKWHSSERRVLRDLIILYRSRSDVNVI